MESTATRDFFCHTCKKLFQQTVLSDDDEVACASCGDFFVEQIEDQAQLATLRDIYNQKETTSADLEEEQFYECNQEEIKQEEESAFQQVDQEIQNLLRTQGQTRTVSQNGQNINVTTVQGQSGNTSIMIANIDNLPEDGGEENDDEGQAQVIDQVQLDIQIDEVPIEQIQPQPEQQQQPHQQPEQPQQQQQQMPFNLGNIINNLLGGGGQFGAAGGAPGNNPPHVQIFHQVLNGFPGFNLPQVGQPQQPGQQANPFNGIFGNILGPVLGGGIQGGGMLQIPNLFQGAQLEQNILNQVLEQSLQFSLNQTTGIPTSKVFIQNLKPVKGRELTEKEECHVCFDQFKEDDTLYRLPCKHIFHGDCILPWLEKHNTCPSCRAELPTDDINYENKKKQTQNDPVNDFLRGGNNNQGGSGGGQGGGYDSMYA